MDGAENQVNLVLATNRNRLLKTEIGITSVTMCFTACSVIAGYFGMNVLNQREDSYSTFIAITAGTTGGALLIALILGLYLRTILR